MNKGDIVFKFLADDKDAQKTLLRLRNDIEETKNQIAESTAQKTGIEEQLESARQAAKEASEDVVAYYRQIQEASEVLDNRDAYTPDQVALAEQVKGEATVNLKEAASLYREQTAEVERLEAEEEKINEQLKQQNALLARQKAEYGKTERRSLADSIKERASSAFSRAKDAANGAKKSTSDVGKSIAKAGKNILKWGLGLQTAFALVNKLKDAIKDAVLGFASKDSETKKNVGALKASLAELKGAWGSAFAPIFNAVAPAINALIGMVTKAANAVAMLIAALSGKGSYKKAIADQEAYAESLEATGGAAKEASKYLSGLDEMATYSSNSGGGGGGGGGGDVDYTEEAIDTGIGDFAAALKDAVERSDWQGLGTLLGEKVNELVNAIPWAELGVKVGDGIRAWFSTKYWTLKAVDFEGIGAHIAEFLNNAIAQINFETIGRTLTQSITVVLDAVIGFVREFDWAQAAQSIADGISGMFKEAKDWISSKDWSQMANDLYEEFKKVITETDWSGVATSIFEAIGSALGAAASFLGTLAKNVLTDIWTAIKEEAMRFDNGDGKLTGDEIMMGILAGILDAVLGIGQWIVDNIFKPFIEGVKSAFGIHSPAETMKEPGSMIGEGLLSGIKEVFTNVKDWVQEHILDKIQDALEAGKELIAKVGVALEKAEEWASDAWDAVQLAGQELATNVGVALEKAKDWATDAWDATQLAGQELAAKVGVALNKAQDWAEDAWAATQMAGEELATKVGVAIERATNWAEDAWQAAQMNAQTVTRTVQSALKKGANWVKDAWSAANMKAQSVTRTVQSAVEKASTWIASAWSAANMKAASIARTLTQTVKDGSWSKRAWAAAGKKAADIKRKLTQSVKSGTWAADAWSAAKKGAASIVRTLTQSVAIGSWVSDAWTAAQKLGETIKRTLQESVEKGPTWVQEAFEAAGAVAGTVKKTLQISISWIGEKLAEAWKVLSGSSNNTVDLNMNTGITGNAMPAMAGGTIVPPLIMTRFEGSYSVDDIVARLDRLLTAQERPIQINTAVEAKVNNKVLFSAVVQQGQAQKNATGKNPFNL